MKNLLFVSLMMLMAFQVSAQEVTRSVYGVNSYGRFTLADTVTAVEFRTVEDDVDLDLGYKADNTSLLIVQGGNVYGYWNPIDSLAVSTSQGTDAYAQATLTNLPPFVRIVVQAADTTNQVIQWRGIKQ
jgi:hypothetical protein